MPFFLTSTADADKRKDTKRKKEKLKKKLGGNIKIYMDLQKHA